MGLVPVLQTPKQLASVEYFLGLGGEGVLSPIPPLSVLPWPFPAFLSALSTAQFQLRLLFSIAVGPTLLDFKEQQNVEISSRLLSFLCCQIKT